MVDPKTRNSTTGMHDESTHTEGVGGRQEQTPADPGGGGYLDNCTDFKNRVSRERADAANDPRLADLRNYGLNSRWLTVASIIGFDEFMAMWQMLDEIACRRSGDDTAEIRFRLPRFKKYLKHQRNLYIKSLAEDKNMPTVQIQKIIEHENHEKLSPNYIRRLRRPQ